jgi:hypothetical protein
LIFVLLGFRPGQGHLAAFLAPASRPSRSPLLGLGLWPAQPSPPGLPLLLPHVGRAPPPPFSCHTRPPPMPTPSPSLTQLHLPPSLPVIAVMKMRHYYRRTAFPDRLRLPPAPIKGRGLCPTSTAPIPALSLLSPSLSATSTELHLRHHFTVIARPPRRPSRSGECRSKFTTLPSPCSTPTGVLQRPGAAGGHAPMSEPPCLGGFLSVPLRGPQWTERSVMVHES